MARDGGGDFVVLFDAVATAASGDTILIAAGVYPETPIYPFPIGDKPASAVVEVAELTIIGCSADSVIIGAESPSPAGEHSQEGISADVGSTLRLHGVTVRNASAGVGAYGDSVVVANSKFVGCFDGVLAHVTASATVRGSRFEGCSDRGVIVTGNRGAYRAEISDSVFEDCPIGIDLQPDSTQVVNCEFRGGIAGIQLSFSARASVRQCRFIDNSTIGVYITAGCHGNLTRNRFSGSMQQNVRVGGLLTGTGNVLIGGTTASVGTTYSAQVFFNGNHILNAGGTSVLAQGGGPPLRVQDFTGNYWGTSDVTQVEEWIIDRSDDLQNNFIVVDFTPMETRPIPTERETVGRLKALYRSPE